MWRESWEKQEPHLVPAWRGLKPHWEISLNVRKEDQLSKSGLEHKGTEGRKVGVNEGPGASSITNTVV